VVSRRKRHPLQRRLPPSRGPDSFELLFGEGARPWLS
jgi:hypothetical protein